MAGQKVKAIIVRVPQKRPVILYATLRAMFASRMLLKKATPLGSRLSNVAATSNTRLGIKLCIFEQGYIGQRFGLVVTVVGHCIFSFQLRPDGTAARAGRAGRR